MRSDIRNPEDAARLRHATVTVFLNGVRVPECVMADEEAGVIERWDIDERGHVRAFYDTGTPMPRLIREHGTVRIEIEEKA